MSKSLPDSLVTEREATLAFFGFASMTNSLRTNAEWKPDLHPRDDEGKFVAVNVNDLVESNEAVFKPRALLKAREGDTFITKSPIQRVQVERKEDQFMTVVPTSPDGEQVGNPRVIPITYQHSVDEFFAAQVDEVPDDFDPTEQEGVFTAESLAESVDGVAEDGVSPEESGDPATPDAISDRTRNLSHRSHESFREFMELEAGEDAAESITRLAQQWEGTSYSPEGRFRAKVLLQAIGADTEDVRNDALAVGRGDDTPTDDEVHAAAIEVAASRDWFRSRSEYGDSGTVHRGISKRAFDEILTAAAESDDDSITIEEFPVSNYARGRGTAEQFADRRSTAVVEREVTAEEVLSVPSKLYGTTNAQETEITVTGGDRQASLDSVQVPLPDRPSSVSLREVLENPNAYDRTNAIVRLRDLAENNETIREYLLDHGLYRL